jgi:hypothetical protein
MKNVFILFFVYAFLSVSAYAQTESKPIIAATLNSFIPAMIHEMTQDMPQWVARTDFSIQFDEDLKPLWSFETVQPLYSSGENKRHTFFTHDRFARTGGDETLNLGLGYRYLSKNEKILFGLNSFFDMTFTHRHRRVGIGAELLGQWYSVHGNYYESFSSTRFYTESSGTRVSEKALDGWDVQGQIQIPFMPWAHAAISGYGWDGIQAKDITGHRLSCRMNITSHIVFEFGRSDDTAGENNFAAMSFTIAPPDRIEYTLINDLFSADFFSDRDLKKHTLTKVRRHNRIVVEKTRTHPGSGATPVTGGVFISRGN